MHGYLRSFRSRVLPAAVTALSLATLASAGTAAADRAPVNTRAAVRTALAHLLAAGIPPITLPAGTHRSAKD